MKKYYYIYKITFLKGRMKGKYYIGKRIGHKSDMINDGYFGSGNMCIRYCKKYPPVIGETIAKEILEVCDSKEELAECEKKWIGDLWETDENCVNLKRGGEGGCGVSYWKGKQLSKGHKLKISKSEKGKKLSDETRKKIGIASTGRKNIVSDITRKKMSESKIGRKHTEETKQKMRESHKGNKASLHYKWVNNNIEHKCIKPELLEQYLSEGWVLGRLPNKRKAA